MVAALGVTAMDERVGVDPVVDPEPPGVECEPHPVTAAMTRKVAAR
jgi:hypothetical protein